MILSSLKD